MELTTAAMMLNQY